MQTLGHIKHNRARRNELHYRLKHRDRRDRVQLLALAIDDPYGPIRRDVAQAFQGEFAREEPGRRPTNQDVVAFLEAVAVGRTVTHAVAHAVGTPPQWPEGESERARITALVALEASPFPEQTAEAIRPLLRCPTADLRYHALIALERLVPGNRTLFDAVIEALEDDDPEVAVVATQIGVKHGWAELGDYFLETHRRLGGEDRLQIAFSIGELVANSAWSPGDIPPQKRQQLVEECIDALGDEAHLAAAARTLANLEATEAVDDLVAVTKKWFAHPILKVDAAAALVDLGHPRGAKYLGKALRSRRKDASGYALRIIGERKIDRFFDALVETATSDDYHADTAALALEDFGGSEARDVLKQLSSSHPDDEVRRLAGKAIRRHLEADPESFDATLDR